MTSNREESASPSCESAADDERRSSGGSDAPMAAPRSEDSSSTTSKTSASTSPAPESCEAFSKGGDKSEGDAPVKRKRGRPFGSKDRKQRVRRRKGRDDGGLEEHLVLSLEDASKIAQQRSFEDDEHHHLGAERLSDAQAWRPDASVFDMINGTALLRAVTLAQQQHQLSSLLASAQRPQLTSFSPPAGTNPFAASQLAQQMSTQLNQLLTGGQVSQLLGGGIKFSQPQLRLPSLNTLPTLQSVLGQGPMALPFMQQQTNLSTW